jgi:S1-C subfamily serine protease
MPDGAERGGQPDACDLTSSSPLSPPPARTGPEPVPRERSGRRTAVVALIAALLSALAGGVVGGYVGSRSAAASYTLGPVPPALTNRPQDSLAGIAARVLPGVVMIKVDGSMGTGSGFVINGGFIVTDNHVVTLDGQVQHAALQVVLNDGQTEPARVVGADPYSDIAVLRLQHPVRLQALPLGNSAGVEVGDPVLAVGSPLGLSGTVTSGIVSAVQRPVQPAAVDNPPVYYDAIQTDAPINPGNSGGPLVNAQAQVIGVNAAIDTLGSDPLTGAEGGSIGLGFAIPINQARLVAGQLIRTGRAAHSVLGAAISVSFGGVGAQIAPAPSGGGNAVTPGGPAARAGLLPGDVIVRFAGQPIDSGIALLDAVRSQPPGARVTVTFVRDGASHTVTLTLGSAESLAARRPCGLHSGPPDGLHWRQRTLPGPPCVADVAGAPPCSTCPSPSSWCSR